MAINLHKVLFMKRYYIRVDRSEGFSWFMMPNCILNLNLNPKYSLILFHVTEKHCNFKTCNFCKKNIMHSSAFFEVDLQKSLRARIQDAFWHYKITKNTPLYYYTSLCWTFCVTNDREIDLFDSVINING